MGISNEKATRVPAPLEKQVRAARRREERNKWIPYFAGAFTVLPLAELWLVPALPVSSKAGHWIALALAALGGFLTEAIYKRLHDPPERPLPGDRDEAV